MVTRKQLGVLIADFIFEYDKQPKRNDKDIYEMLKENPSLREFINEGQVKYFNDTGRIELGTLKMTDYDYLNRNKSFLKNYLKRITKKFGATEISTHGYVMSNSKLPSNSISTTDQTAFVISTSEESPERMSKRAKWGHESPTRQESTNHAIDFNSLTETDFLAVFSDVLESSTEFGLFGASQINGPEASQINGPEKRIPVLPKELPDALIVIHKGNKQMLNLNEYRSIKVVQFEVNLQKEGLNYYLPNDSKVNKQTGQSKTNELPDEVEEASQFRRKHKGILVNYVMALQALSDEDFEQIKEGLQFPKLPENKF